MNISKITLGAAAALLALSLAPAASAQTMNSMDRMFATKAAQGGIFEVKSSQMALKKTHSAGVRAVAQRMVRDHSAANKELKTVAMNEKITLPTRTDPMHRAAIAKMSRQSGAAFDRTYLAEQEKAHTATVNLMRKEIATGKNSGLTIFATKVLPTIQDHTRMIYRTGGRMGVMADKMPMMQKKAVMPTSIKGKNPSRTM